MDRWCLVTVLPRERQIRLFDCLSVNMVAEGQTCVNVSKRDWCIIQAYKHVLSNIFMDSSQVLFQFLRAESNHDGRAFNKEEWSVNLIQVKFSL